MGSFFPGMDPFLEDPGYWPDFHSRFINNWADAISDVLPEQYEANLGERVYLVEHDPEARKLMSPDIGVVESPARSEARLSSASGVTLAPATVSLTVLEGPRETFIEILHKPDRELVTVLELLSPANKEQPGRTEYLAKRRAILYQKVHLVELDLLRAGRRMPSLEALPPGDYCYLVARADRRPDAEVFAWTVRDTLPRLPVPLRTPDPDVSFDLAAVFTTSYDRGRFARKINYSVPLSDLRREDQNWAAETVRSFSSRAHN
ncbi:MAG TPA: DUF4058 family protein [Gemmataceae bacterium]|jgi:hypothetical protein|nr:DUF4058 family protein [Gemmataceae bacterium]